MSKPVRFLTIAYTVPVWPSGTNVIIRRLLDNFGADEVVLLGRKPNRHYAAAAEELHYPTVRIPIPYGAWRGERIWKMVSALMGVILGLIAIRRHKLQAIVAFFPDEGNLLMGYWLHRLTGLPLVPYFCDLYLESNRTSWEAWLARKLQPRVFRSAAARIVVNKGMAVFYKQRYGIETVVAPTVINVAIPKPQPQAPPHAPFVIGYSGSINADRLDPLQKLIALIGGNPDYEIRYFTGQSKHQLIEMGVWAENASIQFVGDANTLIHALSQCDAVYLPLTFKTDHNDRDQLATCFGIKSYEYFAAQSPIIVHSPLDYYTSQFYQERECGYIIGTLDNADLAAALDKLRDDLTLRQRLTEQALNAAHEFQPDRIVPVVRQTLRDITRNHN